MKILFISPGDPRKERLLWAGTAGSMLDGLINEGFEVTLVTVPATTTEQVMRIRRKYAWLTGRRSCELWSDPFVFSARKREMRKKIASLEYDLIFSWMPWCLLLVDSNKPKAFWYDTTFIQTQPLYFANMMRSCLKRCLQMDRQATLAADRAIYSTQWSVESAINDYGADPAKVRQISFGPNMAVPLDEEIHSSLKLRALSLQKQVECILVGIDWHRKGADTAIAAVKRLAEKGVKVRLTIVGGWPPNAVEDGTVRFAGKLDKAKPEDVARLKQLYLESHLLLLPTRADSSPIAVSEALAHGLPCLVSGKGGICGMIRDGVDGYAHALGDNLVTDLAASIEKLAGNPELLFKMSLSARDHYAKTFSWSANWQKLARELKAIS